MPELELVKTGEGRLRPYSQADIDAAERYAKFKERLEPGEFFSLRYWQSPDPLLHRRLLALFRLGFDHWDPAKARKRLTYKGLPIEKNFDEFRRMVTIRAGFFEASYDLRGRVHLEAKSIAYDKMTDEEKVRLIDKVCNVLLEDVLVNYKTRGDLDEVIDKILRFGGTPT